MNGRPARLILRHLQRVGVLVASLALMPLLQASRALTFYVNYSAKTDLDAAAAFDLSILSPYSKADVAGLRRAGRSCDAYLSVVEVARDAPYRTEARAQGIQFFSKSPGGADLADVRDSRWRQFVMTLAAAAAQKGFDGFFLDTIDSVELLEQKFPKSRDDFQNGLIRIIRELKQRYPGKKIILNRGFGLMESVRPAIDGVLVESLFQTFDERSGKYRAVAPSVTQSLLEKIAKIKSSGLPIFVIDYVDPANPRLAERTAQRILRRGFSALVTTPALDGEILAPLREVPRFVLTLYGNEITNRIDAVRWPADSETARRVQALLEWLGYEVDYLNPSTQPLPPKLSSQFCAILLDRSLEISPTKEAAVADWLIRQKICGKRILIFGQIPFDEPAPRNALLRALGCAGDDRQLPPCRRLRARFLAPQCNDEAPVTLHPELMFDLRAPPGAHPLISIAGQNDAGQTNQFDPAFIAPWGGALLDPYLWFSRADGDDLWIVDPFYFLTAALRRPDWPAPDTTTRDGLRIFYTHIDGDGFSNGSSVELGRKASAVILDKIINRYPFPFTCSVIEAEVRALGIHQNPNDSQTLIRLAREIFALPKVHAGSHSYSHPFFWSPQDRAASLYSEPALELRPPFQPARVDPIQEVVGSAQFIENQLLPPGKKVEIFLWPGDCRPPPQAIRLTRQLGIENMNGGDTTLSRQHPSIGCIAPRAMLWDGQLQIYSANQNEIVYTERWQPPLEWNRPFAGGFANAIDTFVRTDRPRRLKPVNIYFHWFSGGDPASLQALVTLFNWAESQPLHAITAAQYAGLVRDARRTRLFRGLEGRWIIVNRGQLRTFRLPDTGQLPDPAASRGVTGYCAGDHCLYLHTDDSRRVELVLSKNPPLHLRLVSSSAEIHFDQLTRAAAAFDAGDLRPIRVILGGLPPSGAVAVNINGIASTRAADRHGLLVLDLPSHARVRVQASSL